MKFKTIEDLKEAGFEGFRSVRELSYNHDTIPDVQGVYMVVLPSDCKPEFLVEGSGGFFKGKNPNVSIEELEYNWVDDTCVVYIGTTSSTLRKRVGDYLKFGMGRNIGHYGGRYIWQLKGSQDLLLCWKKILDKAPKDVEYSLIQEFKMSYGGYRPFANLKD